MVSVGRGGVVQAEVGELEDHLREAVWREDLAHKEQPPHLGPPQGPRHIATVGS